MQVYSFEVLEELFNSTCIYNNYFPTLRGDANVFDTLPFGFEEITLRNTVVILEVEKRILYQLLTEKLLTASECMQKCQSIKITMSDRDIVSKLKIYWRDECCRKAAYASETTKYWSENVTLQHHSNNNINNNNNNKNTDTAAPILLNNSPHLSHEQLIPQCNTSRIVNSDGAMDMIYKEIPSTKMTAIYDDDGDDDDDDDDDAVKKITKERDDDDDDDDDDNDDSSKCITCSTIIPQTCYICTLNGIDDAEQQQKRHRRRRRRRRDCKCVVNSNKTYKSSSIHRYSVNSGLFADFYLFSIEIINKGTQLNRLKNNLKGVVFSSDGIHDTARECNKMTLFRQKYVDKGYIILDVDLMQEKTPPEIANWTEETLKRRQKTTMLSQQQQQNKRARYSSSDDKEHDKELELLEEQSPSSSQESQQESQESQESPQPSPSALMLVKQEDNKEKEEQKTIIGFGFDDDDDLPDLSKLTELFELIPDNDLT